MRRFAIPLLATAALSLGSVPGARAQSLVVQVTASESGAPLGGVLVTLLDGRGEIARRSLSDPAGRAILATAGLSSFSVRAESIGRETVTSEVLGAGADVTEPVRLALPVHAYALDEIVVEAESRCSLRPDEATELARVWDEARKPLAVQTWTEREGLYRLDISLYERDLDADGRRVERETRSSRNQVTRVPFASLPPAQLASEGWVRPLEGGAHEYFGPDAAALLSDEFLDTHCFSLRRSGDVPGAIGLAFEPVRAGGLPDVRGTLWLDEESAELRFLEYRYTWAPYAEAEGMAGGRVEFEALPDGGWIIDRWWIRAPLLARHPNLVRAGDEGIRVAGIRETGGEVVGVSTLDRRRVAQVERATVTGVVWDSTAAAPVAGATVELVGTDHRAETDAAGRFRLENLPGGVYTAAFRHPRLDTLGVDPAVAEVEAAPGRTTEVALAIPSASTILVAACRLEGEAGAPLDAAEGPPSDVATGADGGVISGVVRDRATGEPLPGAHVRIRWQEVERMRPVVQARDRFIEVGTDGQGRYTACGIPVDESLQVQASFLDRRSATADAAFSAPGHEALDLEIELPAELVPGARAADAFGEQGIQGVLLERGSSNPVRSAEVTVVRASGEVVANGTTDPRGFFRLQTPAPGRYVLTARALGYGRVEGEAVEVEYGKLAVLEVQMAPQAFEMEPIVVTSEARAFRLEMEGFYRRSDDGLGTFLAPEIFEERNPKRVSDLLYGVPGTYVAESANGPGGRAIYFRGGYRGDHSPVCWPMVYVDRYLVSTGGFPAAGGEPAAIDELVHPSDVWAMEVFTSPAEVPPEFNGPNAGCGVVVLWTKRGGSD